MDTFSTLWILFWILFFPPLGTLKTHSSMDVATLGGSPARSATMFDVDIFIQSVQERPALWEKSSKDYLDKHNLVHIILPESHCPRTNEIISKAISVWHP